MRFKSFALMTAQLTVTATWAHHGVAEFDQTQPLQLSGTISQTEWANPHVLVHLSVTDADRKVTVWLVECPPPNWMKRSGLPQTALEAGTEVVVQGFQAKDGSNRINVANVASISNSGGQITLIGRKGSAYTRVRSDVPAKAQ